MSVNDWFAVAIVLAIVGAARSEFARNEADQDAEDSDPDDLSEMDRESDKEYA